MVGHEQRVERGLRTSGLEVHATPLVLVVVIARGVIAAVVALSLGQAAGVGGDTSTGVVGDRSTGRGGGGRGHGASVGATTDFERSKGLSCIVRPRLTRTRHEVSASWEFCNGTSYNTIINRLLAALISTGMVCAGNMNTSDCEVARGLATCVAHSLHTHSLCTLALY